LGLVLLVASLGSILPFVAFDQDSPKHIRTEDSV